MRKDILTEHATCYSFLLAGSYSFRSKLEKVDITPSTMGLVYITPQTMKSSISPPELSKTGQITP